MNHPPTGPEIGPDDVDRLIARFNRSADPEKRQTLDTALEGEKERFKEQEKKREAQARSADSGRTM